MDLDGDLRMDEEKKRHIKSEIIFGYCIEQVAKKCCYNGQKVLQNKKGPVNNKRRQIQ
jgi:hypothetical protein